MSKRNRVKREKNRVVVVPTAGKLTCPKCGSTGEFCFYEEVTLTVRHEVVGFNDKGELEIEAGFEHGYVGDATLQGESLRLECLECGEPFDVPTGVKLKLV